MSILFIPCSRFIERPFWWSIVRVELKAVPGRRVISGRNWWNNVEIVNTHGTRTSHPRCIADRPDSLSIRFGELSFRRTDKVLTLN
jgi:hypothetical protein